MKDNFQFSGMPPQMEEMSFHRSRLEIKFDPPSWYRAENALCCQRQLQRRLQQIQSLLRQIQRLLRQRVDTIMYNQPETLQTYSILSLIRRQTILYVSLLYTRACKVDQKTAYQMEYIYRIIVHLKMNTVLACW